MSAPSFTKDIWRARQFFPRGRAESVVKSLPKDRRYSVESYGHRFVIRAVTACDNEWPLGFLEPSS